MRMHSLAFLTLLILFSCQQKENIDPMNVFFAMDTGTGSGSPEEKAAMLKELGFPGTDFSALSSFGRSLDQLPEYLSALDAKGLKLFAVYMTLEMDSDLHCPADLEKALTVLNGRSTVLWIALRSKKFEPASEEGDQAAVSLIRNVAQLAAEHSLRIALYPHSNFYAERVEDNLRLVRLINLPNVGLTFNLCHWLRVENGENLQEILDKVKSDLFMVTINGADFSPGQDYGFDRLIKPLDTGNYDVLEFVQQVRKAGYRGPIGLQGYGIEGDPRINLARSMRTWQSFRTRLK